MLIQLSARARVSNAVSAQASAEGILVYKLHEGIFGTRVTEELGEEEHLTREELEDLHREYPKAKDLWDQAEEELEEDE